MISTSSTRYWNRSIRKKLCLNLRKYFKLKCGLPPNLLECYMIFKECNAFPNGLSKCNSHLTPHITGDNYMFNIVKRDLNTCIALQPAFATPHKHAHVYISTILTHITEAKFIIFIQVRRKWTPRSFRVMLPRETTVVLRAPRDEWEMAKSSGSFSGGYRLVFCKHTYSRRVFVIVTETLMQ